MIYTGIKSTFIHKNKGSSNKSKYSFSFIHHEAYMKIKFKVFLKNKTKVFLMINNFYINFIIIFIGHFIIKSGIVVSYMENFTFIGIKNSNHLVAHIHNSYISSWRSS